MSGDMCSQCPHPFDDHAMVPTGGEPTDGGVVLCPHGCDCFATWAIDGQPPPPVPDAEQIDALRRLVAEEAP
jgi:hypothetical protein